MSCARKAISWLNGESMCFDRSVLYSVKQSQRARLRVQFGEGFHRPICNRNTDDIPRERGFWWLCLSCKKKSYKNDTDSWKEVDSSIFKCCSQGSSQASLTPDAHLSHVHVVVVHVALRSDNRLMSIHLIHTGPGNNPDVHSVYSDYTSKNDCLCS